MSPYLSFTINSGTIFIAPNMLATKLKAAKMYIFDEHPCSHRPGVACPVDVHEQFTKV